LARLLGEAWRLDGSTQVKGGSTITSSLTHTKGTAGLELLPPARACCSRSNWRAQMAPTGSSAVFAQCSQNRPQCLQGLMNWVSVNTCAPLTSPQDHKRQFFQVWLSSLVAPRISHEHEFTYWIFHIDGFRHPLLHAVLFDKAMSEDEYGRDAFLVHRLSIIDGEHSYGKVDELSLSLTSKRLSRILLIVWKLKKKGTVPLKLSARMRRAW